MRVRVPKKRMYRTSVLILVVVLSMIGCESPPQERWFEAVRLGDVATAKQLIKEGVDIQATDLHHDTALMVAAKNQDDAMLRMLLDQGANMSPTNNHGLTAVDLAGPTNSGKILKAQQKIVNQMLLKAIQFGDVQQAKTALKKGANIHAVDAFGYKMLDIAMLFAEAQRHVSSTEHENAYQHMVEYLLESGLSTEFE